MTRKGAAQTQHEPGLARTEVNEGGTGRALRPAQKTKAPGVEAKTPEHAHEHEALGTRAPLPPPHPALVELVRLLARADARRARPEERGTRG